MFFEISLLDVQKNKDNVFLVTQQVQRKLPALSKILVNI